MLPELKDLAQSKQKKPSAPMGSSQALRIGRRLGEEYVLRRCSSYSAHFDVRSKVIEELTAKLKDLCLRLGVPQPAA